VEILNDLLNKWGVKHQKMARPFIKCRSIGEVSRRLNAILDIRLQVFETGLSADPKFLGLIPELEDRVLISCSDAHSGALHRMGREYTVISVSKLDYRHLIDSLRRKQIVYTAEFPPEEGRFFLTGHRGGRKKPGFHEKDEWCCFSPQYAPRNDICPICHKTLTVGVYQRCIEIGMIQGDHQDLADVSPNQKFITMVPLVEIIAHVLNLKTKTAKSIIKIYHEIFDYIGPERNLWTLPAEKVQYKLENGKNQISSAILNAILEVKRENFTFVPYGFDGVYGTLQIGNKGNYNNVNIIHSSKPKQFTLPT
jgi:PHP family Zn ribbon phosphoesterase